MSKSLYNEFTLYSYAMYKDVRVLGISETHVKIQDMHGNIRGILTELWEKYAIPMEDL